MSALADVTRAVEAAHAVLVSVATDRRASPEAKAEAARALLTAARGIIGTELEEVVSQLGLGERARLRSFAQELLAAQKIRVGS